jgi:hypothetical protein
MIEKLAAYRKAIAAFIAPGIVVIIASLDTSSAGGSAITGAEWLYVALAILGTGAVVTAVPNALTNKQKLGIALRTDREIDADTQAARNRAGLGFLD